MGGILRFVWDVGISSGHVAGVRGHHATVRDECIGVVE